MRILRLCLLTCLSITFFATLSNAQQNTAPSISQCGTRGEYCVNRATSNGWCKVQGATEQQMYGPTLVGGLKSREDATAEMCRRYDFGSTDSGKCADVLPKGICDGKRSKEKPSR